MCQEVCEQAMESHARLILTNNYRLIVYELTWENVDFDASLFGESFRIKIDY
jgi:DNA polymerase III sliding clamp (beta) subunit (PCNA family)